MTTASEGDAALDLQNLSAYARLLGLTLVERTDGRSIITCSITESHGNRRGKAHGGVISSLIDTACGASVAYQPSIDRRGVATVSLTVSFLAAVSPGDVLRAVGRRRGPGREVVMCDCEVHDQNARLVAVGMATLRILPAR